MTYRSAAEGIIDHVVGTPPEVSETVDVANLSRLVPLVALTLKSASLTRIAGTLVETYLGRNAGEKF